MYTKSEISKEYFESLKAQSLHENDRDGKINADYSQFCIQT